MENEQRVEGGQLEKVVINKRLPTKVRCNPLVVSPIFNLYLWYRMNVISY